MSIQKALKAMSGSARRAMADSKRSPNPKAARPRPSVPQKLQEELEALAPRLCGPRIFLDVWQELPGSRDCWISAAKASAAERSHTDFTGEAVVDEIMGEPLVDEVGNRTLEIYHSRDFVGRYFGALALWQMAHHLTRWETLVSLARKYKLIDRDDAQRLWRQVSGIPLSQMPGSLVIPQWVRERRELWFAGEVVRRVTSDRPTKIEPILDSFQAAAWRGPMEWKSDRRALGEFSQREALKELRRSLNTGLQRISFVVRQNMIDWEERP